MFIIVSTREGVRLTAIIPFMLIRVEHELVFFYNIWALSQDCESVTITNHIGWLTGNPYVL